MEDSTELRQGSLADDDDIVLDHLESSAARDAIRSGVWERMSGGELAQHSALEANGRDEVAGSTSEDTDRPQRGRHLAAAVEAVLQAAADDADDNDDWVRFFHARDELLRSLEVGILDNIEDGAFNEVEHLLNLWTEVLENQPRIGVDVRAPQECRVCLETKRLDRRPCCDLPICPDCTKKYIETQLKETGVVRIGCPNPDCDRFVFQEEIRELLRSSPELRDHYDRWLVDANADPRRKTCPRCGRITEVPQDARGRGRLAGKYGVMITCPDCQFNWCFSCQAPWHAGLSCSKNRTGDKLLKRWARQKNHDVQNARRCPKCKVRFSYQQRSVCRPIHHHCISL